MLISHLEIANFRKLLSVRIDLAERTTLFVGANNSGKTSAMLAMRRFLLGRKQHQFQLQDITIVHWADLCKIGEEWLEAAILGRLSTASAPFCDIPDRGMFLAPRRSSEESITVLNSCASKLYGLPEQLAI